LPGEYAVGVFGRVRPDKGSDVFVEAMIQALPQLPQVTAVIAGLAQPQHQAYQQELQAKINAAGLQDRIVFLGEVPAGEVHRWYQRCLVCVACPRYEPFGLTPFEAAATGCALICSRTGAFEQLVEPGVNGYLVGTEDPQGLVDSMLKIFHNPEHAAQMGQAAKNRVTQQFSLAQEAAGIAKVYEGLFRSTGTHPSQAQG
jgi:mannosyltransferase